MACINASRPLVPAVLVGALLTAAACGDEAPGPPAGEVRLESGRVVGYTIHFDRNALRDSLRLNDGLISLTSSGALLRFDLPAVRLVRERMGIEEVSCLGHGEDDTVLAGLADGRVCRVDPVMLDLVDLARLPSAPQWVGWRPAWAGQPAGVVAVRRQTKPSEHRGPFPDVPYSVVHDLATGRTFASKDRDDLATAFLLDRTGRLWLGSDRGEWGGRITRVDLNEGTLAEIKPPGTGGRSAWDGVYGFVELRDGQVWAFGGTEHMGFTNASLTRIDSVVPQQLFAGDNGARLRTDPEKRPDPTWPELPITHVVEEGAGLLIFSYSHVFRVDRALRTWRLAGTLDIQYRWGRPDAVGSYPSVRAVHPPRHEGEPYVLATAADGYEFLERATPAAAAPPSKPLPLPGSPRPNHREAMELTATPHALPGQLGAAGVYRVENTSDGTLFFEDDEALPIWRLGPRGWEIVTLAPPVDPDPANPAMELEKDEATWAYNRVLVGPGGAIFTVSGTSLGPEGTRTTARRVKGKTVRLGRETSVLDPNQSFITGDGTLWNADPGALKRFEEGRWQTVAPAPWAESPFDLRALNTNGPP
jgi:hypothetical protein